MISIRTIERITGARVGRRVMLAFVSIVPFFDVQTIVKMLIVAMVSSLVFLLVVFVVFLGKVGVHLGVGLE